jgi:hypothetical protein
MIGLGVSCERVGGQPSGRFGGWAGRSGDGCYNRGGAPLLQGGGGIFL